MDFFGTIDLKGASYVEAIKEGEIVRVPESVAVEEDLFILRKIEQSKSDPQIIEKRPELVQKKSSYLSEWKAGKTGYKKNDVLADLLDNFHWEILRSRRMKNISRKKLADLIGASEEELKIIEMGQLPKDDFVLISRIESSLGINLRKNKISGEDMTLAKLQKMSEDKVRDEIDKAHKRPEIEIIDDI